MFEARSKHRAGRKYQTNIAGCCRYDRQQLGQEIDLLEIIAGSHIGRQVDTNAHSIRVVLLLIHKLVRFSGIVSRKLALHSAIARNV